MFMALVESLLEHFDTLDKYNKAFAQCVRADKDLPALLPEITALSGREAAISAMTRMWFLEPGETLATAGVICSSPATVETVQQLNLVKEGFKEAVKRVRDKGSGEKSRIDRLIDRTLQNEGRRTEALALALKNAGINRLDLLRCYAKIRILPKHLKSISWTWAKTHSVIDSLTRDEAIEQAKNLSNEEAQAAALDQLARLGPHEKLVYKKKLPNQLRANLVWEENDTVKRKSVTISGLVISQDQDLPRYVWRENPEDLDEELQAERLTRLDTKINPEPYIKSLKLHLYA